MAVKPFARRSRRFFYGCAVALIGQLAVPAAEALDEESATLSASVEVAPVFSLSLTNPHLAFAELRPGQPTVLGEGRFFNEVACRSNSGHPWLLTAQILSLHHAQGGYALPASALEWSIVEATGSGQIAHGPGIFNPFSDQSVLLYSAQGDDTKGHPVFLHFRYRLTSPLDAPAGSYVGEIVFTMTESL